ncbi:MAG TPA: glucose-6-phosphate dehydrogenase, partial [Jatrophihabitantaceae bacterium]|nr:glucose-6-phosphate dehydrogenase [Jatrophihabitantaceae bacterium]
MDIESERRAPACVFVIFGASGDLTERKLLPAVERLCAYNRLPWEFGLVGVGRTPMTDGEFAERLRRATRRGDSDQWADLVASVRYVSGGYDDPATYGRLAEVLDEFDRTRGTAGGRVFYLATPPQLFGDVASSLGKSGLSDVRGEGFVRIVIEKPFGWDEDSARAIYAQVTTAFEESQVFRIDHYLAK